MLKKSKNAQQDNDGWVLLGSPSRTNPPELPVPETTTRKASCKAKKGAHALIFFPPRQKECCILEVSHMLISSKESVGPGRLHR